jgi:hypothetical protein
MVTLDRKCTRTLTFENVWALGNTALNDLAHVCQISKYDWSIDSAPPCVGSTEGEGEGGGGRYEVVLGADLLYSSAMASKVQARQREREGESERERERARDRERERVCERE